jgi:Uma2 family endonuclease
MSSQPKSFLTPQEFLEQERKAERKSEYLAGEVFAMAGASEQHVLIVKNLAVALDFQIRGASCRVYLTDMRVRVECSGLYTYPDLVAVCGKPAFEDEKRDTLLNPLLIVEVLSRSTENYDRGGKFAMYRKLDSLQEYLLVTQYAVHVERYLRQPGGQWLMTEADHLEDSLQLSSVPAILKLKDIYQQVDFLEGSK